MNMIGFGKMGVVQCQTKGGVRQLQQLILRVFVVLVVGYCVKSRAVEREFVFHLFT